MNLMPSSAAQIEQARLDELNRKAEARAEGADGVATTTNAGGRVMGAFGCALFAVERADSGKISSVAAGIVDGVNIKPDTWYACRGGKLVEVKR